jgi:hypothetical protein
MPDLRSPVGGETYDPDPRELFLIAIRLAFPMASQGQIRRALAAGEDYAAALIEQHARLPYPPPRRQPKGAA